MPWRSPPGWRRRAATAPRRRAICRGCAPPVARRSSAPRWTARCAAPPSTAPPSTTPGNWRATATRRKRRPATARCSAPGGPPEQFALEYYQTLAATDAGAEEGRRGLGRIADRPNADPRTRLAFAQTLTYQPGTRAEGIRRLAGLRSSRPLRPRRAAPGDRRWSGASGTRATAPQVDSYLQRFPDDADLRRRAEAAKREAAAPPDPGSEARREGFARLDAGGLRDATRQFETALAANPNDADALGGLGIVRLREGKQAEARTLLERAIAVDPARAPQWQRALDGASYGAELAEGRRLLRASKLDEADEVLRRASRREAEDKTDAEVLLGELALRRSDPAAAEQRFRAALTRRPGFVPAQTGLNQALRAQGRMSEVVAVAVPRTPQSAAEAQVAEMRAEAARSSDPARGGRHPAQCPRHRPDRSLDAARPRPRLAPAGPRPARGGRWSRNWRRGRAPPTASWRPPFSPMRTTAPPIPRPS